MSYQLAYVRNEQHIILSTFCFKTLEEAENYRQYIFNGTNILEDDSRIIESECVVNAQYDNGVLKFFGGKHV
jgi:hypothetical protein